MRREGVKFDHRSNHTLRNNHCPHCMCINGIGSCKYHNYNLWETAYSSLREKTHRFSFTDEEQFAEVVALGGAEGPMRSRIGACLDAAKGARRGSDRYYPPPSKHQAKEDLRKSAREEACMV